MIKKLNIVIALLLGLSTATMARESQGVAKDGDTIAFLGDSITAGGASYNGYCRLVIHGLKTKGIHVKGIFAGVSGNKSSDMLLRLDGILRQNPDLLFLSAGVNDIWHADHTVKIGVFQAKPGMGVTFEHYKVYVPQILDRCKAAGVDVILSTITPITEDPEFKLNKTAETYNAFLYEQAKERNLPIARLNEAMFAKIAELKAAATNAGRRNMLTSDGVHPGTAGHQVMAKGVLKAMGLSEKDLDALQSEWNQSPRILIVGDRQTHAGGREGGWCSMLLDGMNAGREMVTPAKKVAHKKTGTLAALLPKLDAAVEGERIRYLLLVPPLGDVQQTTSTDAYRAALLSLIAFAEENELKLVITTIPMLNNNLGSAANKSLLPYNNTLRTVCQEQEVPLADISKMMAGFYEKQPDSSLTIGDERLNHEGGMLLAEVVLSALGHGAERVEALRSSWDACGSYTFRYGSSVSFGVSLSEAGETALQEISDRYHKLREGNFLALGVGMLLNGSDEQNQKRINYVDRTWLGGDGDTVARSHRMAPATAKQNRAIQDYTQKQKIDRVEFYTRAYKVGMHVMRNEDPLGRGDY